MPGGVAGPAVVSGDSSLARSQCARKGRHGLVFVPDQARIDRVSFSLRRLNSETAESDATPDVGLPFILLGDDLLVVRRLCFNF